MRSEYNLRSQNHLPSGDIDISVGHELTEWCIAP